jgi:hypothetical protein
MTGLRWHQALRPAKRLFYFNGGNRRIWPGIPALDDRLNAA